MKRNKLVLAATSGLVGLSVLAGSMAYAASQSDGKSAEELQQFLTANPKVAAVVADGSEQEVLYTLADNSMTVNAEDQNDDVDNDAETDDDGENETNDDNDK